MVLMEEKEIVRSKVCHFFLLVSCQVGIVCYTFLNVDCQSISIVTIACNFLKFLY